ADSPETAVDANDVARLALEAMEAADAVPAFTRQTETKSLDPTGDLRRARQVYLRYLRSGVLMECSGTPRKAQPNLEDTGLVVADYLGLDNIEAVEAATEENHRLGALEPTLRIDLLRAVLDQVRRGRAISSEADNGPAMAFTEGLKFASEVV